MTSDLRLTRESEVDERNPVAGDLHVEGVDFAIVRGIDAIVQEIEVRLRWWKGEWFLDRRKGVPYIGSILKKGVSLAAIRAILAREIRSVPGVLHVERIDLELDATTRRLTGAAVIRVSDGTTESSEPVEIF